MKNYVSKSVLYSRGVSESIVPGSRWNILPPGTITGLTLPARQGLKLPLENLVAAKKAAKK